MQVNGHGHDTPYVSPALFCEPLPTQAAETDQTHNAPVAPSVATDSAAVDDMMAMIGVDDADLMGLPLNDKEANGDGTLPSPDVQVRSDLHKSST